MAGTQRVQAYLERHKIGILFEELMGKVIADQPDEPVHYLIRALERKSNRQSQVLRRSTDGEKMAVPKERTSYDKPWQSNSKKMKGRDSSAERASKKSTQSKPDWNNSTKTEVESFDDLWDTREGSRSKGQRSSSPSRKHAVSWGDGEELMGKVIADQPDEPVHYLIRALERKSNRQSQVLRRSTDGEKMAVPKERTSYDKPWQSNSKKMKGRDSSAERASKKSTQSKPDWNNSTKTEVESFDDLWDTREGSRSKGQRSSSPSRKHAVSWGDGEEELYSSYGYSGPHRHQEIDPLDGEFSVSKETTPQREQPKLIAVPKGKNQQKDSEKHKQELQRLVLNRKSAEDSGIEDDRDLQMDEDAVELMENLDDLRSEGVTSVKSGGGVTVRSTARQTGSAEPTVRVSICARCAKVMSGEASERPRYRELDDSDTETNRNYSRPQSAVRFSPDTAQGSDEEFESVSQVTGPRHPVWQDDSDDESVTPRKGKHMFASSTVPAKGRHMYSPQSSDQTTLKQTAVKVAQSTDFTQSTASRAPGNLKGHSAFNKTWSPELDVSEKSEPAKEDEGTTRTAHSLTTGGGWKVPNYDEDNASSFYGSPGNKGRKDFSGPY